MPAGTHDALPDPRNEDVRIWINGRLTARQAATVSVFDAGYLVGDGVWEGIRLHHGVLAFLEMHLDRLEAGLDRIRIRPRQSRAELVTAMYDTLAANQMTDGAHLRLMITRGLKKTPSQDPRLSVSDPNVVIIAEHKTANPEAFRRGITLHTSSVRRPPPDTLDQRLNCHSKLHEVMALQEALDHGADEALMLDTRGFVATCNATNFFAVVGGEVWTSTAQHCLPGITRANVLRVARELGLPAREIDFTPTQLEGAEEAFVTGTFGGLTPVREVDERPLSAPGALTTRLRDSYRSLVGRYCESAGHRVT